MVDFHECCTARSERMGWTHNNRSKETEQLHDGIGDNLCYQVRRVPRRRTRSMSSGELASMPAAPVAELTSRQWKVRFAANPLRSARCGRVAYAPRSYHLRRLVMAVQVREVDSGRGPCEMSLRARVVAGDAALQWVEREPDLPGHHCSGAGRVSGWRLEMLQALHRTGRSAVQRA